MPSVIKIPAELAQELDRLAGAEHKPRTTYVVDVLWRDVKRNKQRQALKLSAGTWNPADHPELAQGGAAASSGSGRNAILDSMTLFAGSGVDGHDPSRYFRHLRSL